MSAADTTGAGSACCPQAAARFLNPRSVAIVGMSTRARHRRPPHPAMPEGERLCGRCAPGRPQRRTDRRPACAEERRRVPGGRRSRSVRAARRGGREAIVACARRKVGSAMVFAAGLRDWRHATQEAVTTTARAAGARRGRAQLPRHHQQCRRHDAAHALCPRGAARRRTTAWPSSVRAADCLATSSAPPTGAAFRCPMSSRPATRRVSRPPISSNS